LVAIDDDELDGGNQDAGHANGGITGDGRTGTVGGGMNLNATRSNCRGAGAEGAVPGAAAAVLAVRRRLTTNKIVQLVVSATAALERRRPGTHAERHRSPVIGHRPPLRIRPPLVSRPRYLYTFPEGRLKSKKKHINE